MSKLIRWLLLVEFPCAALIPGCAELINPFQDDLPATGQVTTASKNVILEKNGKIVILLI